MSTMISSIFIFSLYFSLRACDARFVINGAGFSSRLFHSPIKVFEKVNISNTGSTRVGLNEKWKEMEEREDATAAAAAAKPLVSVSSNNRLQKPDRPAGPGLFSDYSRPRTRPPSHN
ncbi:uncharacterized protein LOC127791563 [Diospyros lotus]|uniref:uncharacterized protein LOC127791563 n=1 Tax=Diospyros lotus TaxID=55363 RepID=UPI002252AF85|nr:uncharacterized protein LOC127791563 [Diospyros lotus]